MLTRVLTIMMTNAVIIGRDETTAAETETRGESDARNLVIVHH